MKKFYSLFLLMLFAIVGAGQAWAEEYKAEDLKKDDIIQIGDVIDASTKEVYFAESEETAGGAYLDFYDQTFTVGTTEPCDSWDLDYSTFFSKYTSFVVVDVEYTPYGYNIVLIIPNEAGNETPEPEKIELELSEENDITEALHNNVYDKVTLARTLYANTWSTFTVPFNMTNAQLKANFGDDVVVKSFNGVSVNGENCSLAFKTQTEIHAGVPYMIKTTKDVTSIEVENVTVLVQLLESTQSDNGTTVVFKPVLSKIPFAPSNSYVISNNAFYYVGAALVPIKGYRGYFTVENAALSNMALSFNFEDNEPTSIDSVNADYDVNAVYDLQGRRVKSLTPNQLYIQNGRKMIIK